MSVAALIYNLFYVFRKYPRYLFDAFHCCFDYFSKIIVLLLLVFTVLFLPLISRRGKKILKTRFTKKLSCIHNNYG